MDDMFINSKQHSADIYFIL